MDKYVLKLISSTILMIIISITLYTVGIQIALLFALLIGVIRVLDAVIYIEYNENKGGNR